MHAQENSIEGSATHGEHHTRPHCLERPWPSQFEPTPSNTIFVCALVAGEVLTKSCVHGLEGEAVRAAQCMRFSVHL